MDWIARHYRAVALIVFGFGLLALAVSARDLVLSPGVDLRPKVVGARALVLGLDPYREDTFRLRPSTPEYLTDPDTVWFKGVSRVTYPPTLLALYIPLCWTSYAFQRVFWWVAEWAALAASIAILAFASRDPALRRGFAVYAIAMFCGAWFWRYHVERGQYYVYVTLLISADLWALEGSGVRPKWCGVPIGLAAAFRPTVAVMSPLLWVMGEKRAALLSLATAGLAVLGTLSFVQPELWKSYFDNISTMLNEVGGVGPSVFTGGPIPATTTVEGVVWSYDHVLERGPNLTLCALLHRYGFLRAAAAHCIPASRYGGILILIAGIVTVYGLTRRPNKRDAALIVLLCTPLLVDYLSPMRWEYADVLFLPLVYMIFKVAFLHRSRLLFAGLLVLLATAMPLHAFFVDAFRQVLVFALAAGAGATSARGRSVSLDAARMAAA